MPCSGAARGRARVVVRRRAKRAVGCMVGGGGGVVVGGREMELFVEVEKWWFGCCDCGGLECCLSVEWIAWIEMDGIAHVGWALYIFFGEYGALLVLLSGSKWVVGVGCRVQTLVLQRARFGGRRLVLELNPDDRIGSKVCGGNGETQCSNLQ